MSLHAGQFQATIIKLLLFLSSPSFQRQNPPRLEFSTERTNQEISEDVVKSPRMAAVVSKISRAFGKPEDEVVKEAQEILREMAHAR